MSFHIKHLHKYTRWLRNAMSTYRENCKFNRTYARLHLALTTSQLLQKPEMIDRAARRKHAWVLSYMKRNCAETIRKYRNMPAPANLYEPQHDPKVWSMWWQGEDQADPLFRMCIQSARIHTHRPVITLSKDNYREYFDIPDHILRKFNEGKIKIQHICDLMVVSIMAAEGGSLREPLSGGRRMRRKVCSMHLSIPAVQLLRTMRIFPVHAGSAM